MVDGERAFVDSDQYFVADVPIRYEGRRFLRTLAEPNMEKFSFDVNVPATVYIASLIDEALPLEPGEGSEWKAHDTDDTISVLFGVSSLGRALESRTMRVRFISLREGGKAAFRIRQKGVPFLIFAEEKKDMAFSCGKPANSSNTKDWGALLFGSPGGEEEVLSLVGGHTYAHCIASSEESSVFGCTAALNGRLMDAPNGVWRTLGGNGRNAFPLLRTRVLTEVSLQA